MTIRGLAALAVTIAAGIALTGCATPTYDATLKEQPAYVQGYTDGCATASERAKNFGSKTVRDDFLFGNDKAYQAGWRQGFIACGDRVPTDGLDSSYEAETRTR